MNAQQAIARSVSHDEIVTFEASASDHDALSERCEDSCDLTAQYGYVDYWGSDGDGDWRVQARVAP